MLKQTLDLAVGLAFCVFGVLLASGRPRRAVAALMVATGGAWLLGATFPAALYLYRGPLGHLLVSYPGGRLRSRRSRIVAVIGYLLSMAPHPNQWVTLIWAAAVVAVVIDNWRRADREGRRERAAPAAVCVALMAILVAAAAARMTGLAVDPWLAVVFDLVALASAVVLYVDARWRMGPRQAIRSLVIDLGRPGSAGAVSDKLGRALGDPSLQITFVDPVSGAAVDEAGRPALLAPAGGGREQTTLHDDGRTICVVRHAAGVLDDARVRHCVTALTAVAFANIRLQAQVLARVADVELSRRRILDAADGERRILEVKLRAGTEDRLDRVASLLGRDAELQAMLVESRRVLTDFARGVHPRALAAGGLAAACRELAAGAHIPVRVHVSVVGLSAEAELQLYFVCAEALTNIGKYANATRVDIHGQNSQGCARLTITDNGCGGALLGPSHPDAGTGLGGLADRLAVIDGTLTVRSPAGHGTTITAVVPLNPDGPDDVNTGDRISRSGVRIGAGTHSPGRDGGADPDATAQGRS